MHHLHWNKWGSNFRRISFPSTAFRRFIIKCILGNIFKSVHQHVMIGGSVLNNGNASNDVTGFFFILVYGQWDCQYTFYIWKGELSLPELYFCSCFKIFSFFNDNNRHNRRADYPSRAVEFAQTKSECFNVFVKVFIFERRHCHIRRADNPSRAIKFAQTTLCSFSSVLNNWH